MHAPSLLDLPDDLLIQILLELDAEDWLRLRLVSRAGLATVDGLTRWDSLWVQRAGQELSRFVQRVRGCRPAMLRLGGGACWPAASEALRIVGPGVRDLFIDRAPVGQAQLNVIFEAMPRLRHLTVANVMGGAVALPAAAASLDSLVLRSGHGPDIWDSDLCVSLGGLAASTTLSRLVLVLDKPHGQLGSSLADARFHATLTHLTAVQWGAFDLRHLQPFQELHTLVLHAAEFYVSPGVRLPSVRRLCVPYTLLDEALTMFPALDELFVYATSSDDLFLVDLDLVAHLKCLSLFVRHDVKLLFMCESFEHFDAWALCQRFRLFCHDEVECIVTCDDLASAEFSLARTVHAPPPLGCEVMAAGCELSKIPWCPQHGFQPPNLFPLLSV